MVKTRFIKNRDTQVLVRTIRLRHLKEGIDLTNSGNVVWNKWLDLCVQINLLWLVTLNVLKHFLQLLWNWQVCILVRVICSWNFLLIFIILLIFLLLGTLLHLLLRNLSRLLLLSLRLHVNIHIHFIFLFIRVNLFRVVHIDGKIKRLILNLAALYFSGLCWSTSWLGRGSNVCLHR